MNPEVDDTSYEGGDGGSPSQGSPSPDRDRPAVGAGTGEIQGQGDAVDPSPPEAPLTPEEAEAFENRQADQAQSDAAALNGPAPLTGAESDNPRLPSPPEAPLTPEEAEAFEAREAAEGSIAEDSPLSKPPDQTVGGVDYHPVWDRDNQVWDFVDNAGKSLYSTAIGSDGESDRSAVVRFWDAVDSVRTTEQAKAITDEAVARLLRDEGPKLAELQATIHVLEKPGWDEDLRGQTDRLNALSAAKAEWQEILDAYDPSKEHSSQLPTGSFVTLDFGTKIVAVSGPPRLTPELMDPHQKAQYAPNIDPDQGVRLGKYAGLEFDHASVRSSVGDAYAYNTQTDKVQVANDLERLARAGYTEIHIATGTHGSRVGGLAPENQFLREDARSIMETMQRHPGLKIIPYNMGDPVQASSFDALQELAAKNELPGGATLAAHCFSRTRVMDPDPGPAPAIAEVEIPDAGPSKVFQYGRAGQAVGFGALSVYSGVEDPNKALGALKAFGGSVQIMGGASSALGHAIESVNAVRAGSILGDIGGRVVAPLALIDMYREMQRDLGHPLEGEEAVFKGVEDTLKVVGVMYPPAAVGAIAVEFGVKPVAEEVSEYLTPMFLGAISEAYGVPQQYVWGMSSSASR